MIDPWVLSVIAISSPGTVVTAAPPRLGEWTATTCPAGPFSKVTSSSPPAEEPVEVGYPLVHKMGGAHHQGTFHPAPTVGSLAAKDPT